MRAVCNGIKENTLAKVCPNISCVAWQNTSQRLSGKKMRLRYGAGCLAGDKWGQLWEEHWVLRDKKEVREEEGLISEKGTKPGQRRAQLTKSRGSIRPSKEGPVEEPRPHR